MLRTVVRPASALSVLLAALLACVLVFPGLAETDGITGQAVRVFVVWVLCLATLVLRSPGGSYGAAPVYMFLFGLFHGGLLFTVALVGDRDLVLLQSGWVYLPYTVTAVRLSIVAMLVFTLAAVTGGLRRARVQPPATGPATDLTGAMGMGGLVVLGAGLAMFVASLVQAGGLAALSGGYSTFMEELDGTSPLGYAMLCISVGTVLAVVAGGRHRNIGWVCFGAFSLIAFPLGTRGSVLFPLAGLAVVEARRGVRIRLPVAAALTVGVLTLVGVVRATRQGGIGALLDASWLVSPLDAVSEMGHSLRPTVIVLGWHAAGEPYQDGITFIAVFVRLVERWTGWHGGPPVVDDRLFNQEIIGRVGPVGGSPIAEGYHNLGLLGVIGVLALLGVVIGLLDAGRGTLLSDATLGVVLIPLYIQVRNSSASVLMQIAVGLCVLVAVRIAARHGGRRVVASVPFSPPPARRPLAEPRPVRVPRGRPPRERARTAPP